MEKKGQLTLFIILGVILIVAVALYFIAVKTEIIPPLLAPTDAASEMAAIDEHITECLEDVGGQYVNQIGYQGGYLGPAEDTYRLYNDSTVAYLCFNQEDLPTCTNRLLTVAHMEEELDDAITQALSTCINVYDYSDDVTAADAWDLTVTITRASVNLDLNYPVQVTKGDDRASEDMFSGDVDAPLGELYEVSQDIVNEHASIGDFDQLLYMLSKLSRYTIYKNKPYPDVIYQVRLREDDYIFQFAIQGESNV